MTSTIRFWRYADQSYAPPLLVLQIDVECLLGLSLQWDEQRGWALAAAGGSLFFGLLLGLHWQSQICLPPRQEQALRGNGHDLVSPLPSLLALQRQGNGIWLAAWMPAAVLALMTNTLSSDCGGRSLAAACPRRVGLWRSLFGCCLCTNLPPRWDWRKLTPWSRAVLAFNHTPPTRLRLPCEDA